MKAKENGTEEYEDEKELTEEQGWEGEQALAEYEKSYKKIKSNRQTECQRFFSITPSGRRIFWLLFH